MNPIQFEVPYIDFQQLQQKYSLIGKNGDIGKFAVEIAILYFKSINPEVIIRKGKKGVDLVIQTQESTTNYEIKGTESLDIAFDKLRVSSKDSYQALVDGMMLLRVANVRNRKVSLYFLEYGVHYILIEEPRWRLKRVNI